MHDLFAPAAPAARNTRVHVGIGGWTYAPWRGGVFYPEGLVQRRELEYASRQLTAIEINGTYYGAQKPATYAKWRDETPPGFVFTAKAPKRIMASRRLAGTGAQIEDFVGGICELGDRLGALSWQFERGRAPTPTELEAFLALLPARAGGRPLRHALELREAALLSPQVLALMRQLGVRDLFAGLVGADTLPVRKPDPAPYRLAVERAGGAARSMLVGDTETDRRTGLAAGVPVALVTFGHEGEGVARLEPEALIGHFDELPGVAARLLG